MNMNQKRMHPITNFTRSHVSQLDSKMLAKKSLKPGLTHVLDSQAVNSSERDEELPTVGLNEQLTQWITDSKS